MLISQEKNTKIKVKIINNSVGHFDIQVLYQILNMFIMIWQQFQLTSYGILWLVLQFVRYPLSSPTSKKINLHSPHPLPCSFSCPLFMKMYCFIELLMIGQYDVIPNGLTKVTHFNFDSSYFKTICLSKLKFCTADSNLSSVIFMSLTIKLYLV